MASKQSALLLVDIQNDFCEGGALEVPDSNGIFPVVNEWIAKARKNDWTILASRDWHPVEHISFEDRGGPWPVHCVQDTVGSAFHADMQLPDDAVRVSKGTAFDTDAYSAFDGTELASFLRRHDIATLYIVGLALDVCVKATVKDALEAGFSVELIVDGTRAVDADGAENVLRELEQAGAHLHR